MVPSNCSALTASSDQVQTPGSTDVRTTSRGPESVVTSTTGALSTMIAGSARRKVMRPAVGSRTTLNRAAPSPKTSTRGAGWTLVFGAGASPGRGSPAKASDPPTIRAAMAAGTAIENFIGELLVVAADRAADAKSGKLPRGRPPEGEFRFASGCAR